MSDEVRVKTYGFFAAKLPGVQFGQLFKTKKLRYWYVGFINKLHANKELQVQKKVITKFSYLGKKVFIGMDVHKKTYTIAIWCDGAPVKTATVPADIKKLIESVKKWFEGAEIYSCYEAGFCGFRLHRELVAAGIKNIVVNPASIEVAANDKKTDPRDAKKMAEQLSVGRLRGIYIPTEKEELARLITRTREQVMMERSRVSHRIKARLFQFGLIKKDDDRLINEKYLEELMAKELPEELKYTLQLLIKQWRFFSEQVDDIKTEMKAQSFEDAQSEAIYQSVPGVGDVSARVLANELGDLSKRFKSQESLFQFVGLTPSEYSSGEKRHLGNIDKRGSARVRKILVECAWRAIDGDPALKEIFNRIASTRGKKRAIVVIARKLIDRIRACFVTQTEYCVGLAA